ncbi:radical SAM protein [Sphingomonas sp. R-74633]|uniref:radical SAM protein n=1 Tax=Sphingomonas sp. R-74633 TaxID=2751188 RepID=UPI0015D1F10F|nr:radical SAM protein [Sphingomonas sp. R-74633]NYT42430.1 radical SAM protein [Sphingomonas sp. R-74633]
MNMVSQVAEPQPAAPTSGEVVDLMLSVLSDGLDHPELWEIIPSLMASDPMLVPTLQRRLGDEPRMAFKDNLRILLGMCAATEGDVADVIAILSPLAARYSQSAMVQGALFHLEGRLDPGNPRFQLAGKLCLKPFTELDVLEDSAHLCCASFLPTSVGSLKRGDWQSVWNGETAQAIRASMLDGSYRYCNKRTCPPIMSGTLKPIAELEADPRWGEIIKARQTEMPHGPEMVNLAYDRTCNLSCPSCRTQRYAADDATRAVYEDMQERAILPLLTSAKTVFVTGSGDPFASKNFRRLMEQLTVEEYPALKFIIMTNGMLFTRRQWDAFPSLHGRVESLRISLDAATGPTHELLRRGARWETMLENMKFAGELKAAGLVDDYLFAFAVQQENYREMGDLVDLAKQMGANSVYFGRLTNWGTFSQAQYEAKAVFLPDHPEYAAFLEAARDPRLRDPIVCPSDLDEFFAAA